jgi:hypothetical protein
MKKTLTITLLSTLLLPNSATSGIADEVAERMCKECGVPPRSACMDKLAKEYPQIDASPKLQDEVMQKYQNMCVMGMGTKGNPKMDTPSHPAAAGSMNRVTASSSDCSTDSFTVAIPDGWECRKMQNNAQDVTVYGYRNMLNVTLGKNQGQTSCSVIPVCKSDKYELSSRFDTTRFTNPMIGTYEYAGQYKKDSSFKLTITSNKQPTAAQLGEIKAILNSFKTK